MAHAKVQLDSNGKRKLATDGNVVLGDGDPCCCGCTCGTPNGSAAHPCTYCTCTPNTIGVVVSGVTACACQTCNGIDQKLLTSPDGTYTLNAITTCFWSASVSVPNGQTFGDCVTPSFTQFFLVLQKTGATAWEFEIFTNQAGCTRLFYGTATGDADCLNIPVVSNGIACGNCVTPATATGGGACNNNLSVNLASGGTATFACLS